MKRPATAARRMKQTEAASSRKDEIDGFDADVLQREIGATRGVLVHVPLPKWRALKHLSVDRSETLQVLMIEAIELLLEHNPPASKGEQ
jgi:hypothetical protein